MIRPLFSKYQNLLLWFANTHFGREYLDLWKWAKIKNNYPIFGISPDGVKWWTKERDSKGNYICQAVFFPKSQYLKKFALALQAIELCQNWIYSFEEAKQLLAWQLGFSKGSFIPNVIKRVMFTETTFNPDAHPESTSVDGSVYVDNTNGTWAVMRATAGSSASDVGVSSTALIIATSDTNFNNWQRSILLYDTSSLGSSAVISTTTLPVQSFCGTGAKYDTWTPAGEVVICGSSPASNTALVAADLQQVQTTAFTGKITIANWSITAYNDHTWLEAQLANISKTGITKTSIQLESDRSNSAPSSMVSNYRQWVQLLNSDNGSNKPKLVVTFIVPASGYMKKYW